MDEHKAIELLGKLKKFMEDTSKSIKDLMIITHNQQVEINALKKKAGEKKIILPH